MNSNNVLKKLKNLTYKINSDINFVGKPTTKVISMIGQFIKYNICNNDKLFLKDMIKIEQAQTKQDYIDGMYKVSFYSSGYTGDTIIIYLYVITKTGFFITQISLKMTSYKINNVDYLHSIKLGNYVFNNISEDLVSSSGQVIGHGRVTITKPVIVSESRLEKKFNELIDVLNKYDLYQAPNENNELIGDEVHLALEELKEVILSTTSKK